MLKRWFPIAMFILVISAPGIAPAERELSGDFGRESGTVLLAQNDPSTVKGVYNSLAIYQGAYDPKRIYKRRTPSDGWVGNNKPSHISQVRCMDAYNALSAGGQWMGNLNKDGSCGNPAEPAEWALGNYLNYLDAAAGSEQ